MTPTVTITLTVVSVDEHGFFRLADVVTTETITRTVVATL